MKLMTCRNLRGRGNSLEFRVKSEKVRVKRHSSFSFILSIALLFGASGALAADWTGADGKTYTPLKYLKASGNEWILINDFSISCTDIVKMKFTPVASSCQGLWCSRISSDAQFSAFYSVDTNKKVSFYRRKTYLANNVKINANNDCSVVANYGTREFSVNGELQTLSSTNFDGDYGGIGPIMLFATYTAGKPTGTTGNRASYYFYYFELYDCDSKLKHCLMPAKNGEGVAGLYDTVTRKFYGPTSGTFTGEVLSSVATATWTGAANNGDFSDPGNWTCYDIDGTILEDVTPEFSTDIKLAADVTANDWTEFNAGEYAGTIDVNGHLLVLKGGSDLNFLITDKSTGNRGELRFTIPENETFTNETLVISGNLSLVKDGPGSFVWGGNSKNLLEAQIPIVISNGVFKLDNTTDYVLGSTGTITVCGEGQYDINYGVENGYCQSRHRTFYIEGDGPDGSGAIVNKASIKTKYARHLKKVILTGDATIGGDAFIDFRDSGTGIDCGGYKLTVKNTGRLCVEAGTHLTNATDIVVNGGNLLVCNSCELGADRIVLQNGGTFENYINDITKVYNVPFVVRAGSETSITNTITTSKNYFTMNKPITVESGAVLSLPKGGPWYAGFTNETDATIVVSGGEVCLSTSSILKNDGVLDHIGGNLYVGHRDNDTGACAVENNGLIRSSGGEFVFKPQSSMTGTGTLELVGGSPQILGNLSGFTGTVVVSNDVAITFAGMNCGGTVAVYEGSTLTVDAASTRKVANMELEAGSTLNVANYNGSTPIEVAESTTLPSDGKVNLKLNGGAFGEGIYAICKMSGVTAADGAKFAPSTGELEPSWSVDGDTLILTVGAVDGNTWTGRAGDGDLSNPKNWYGGRAVPTSGTVTINTSGELTVGDTFRPDVIVFPETCGSVTIKGENPIAGLTAITNLSVSTCTFEVPVAFADKICVSQGAYYYYNNSNNQPALSDGGKVRFAGGVTGLSFADDTSRRLDGAFTIPASANWTAATTAGGLWTVTGGSSLTLTGYPSEQQANNFQSLNNNGAFTTAVIRTSSLVCLRNEGEFVVTEELAMTLPGADRHIAQRKSQGKYKFEKVTLGDNGTFGVFYVANRGEWYTDKHVYIGAGGLCFAEGAQPNTAYAFGRENKDNIHIYPWHSDYTIGAKGGTTRDIIIIKPTYFHTDDENGAARTVTLNGVADVRAGLTLQGHGRFQVNSKGLGTGGITAGQYSTLAYASGADLGAGSVLVGSNATLELASGEHTFEGGLTLNDGATLAFNFTQRAITPQIAIAADKVLTVKGAVKVKIPADSKWPTAGEKILTTCGGFTADKVFLAEGAPKWVRGLSVNEDGNIVLDVKPMGTRVIVR